MTVDTIDIDRERVRARFMQVPQELPLKPQALRDFGISPLSTVSRAEPLYKPTLSPPRKHILVDVIEAHQRTESLSARKTSQFEAFASKSMAKMDALSLEQAEVLQKELDAARKKESWSVFMKVCQYVAAVTAITTAMTMVGAARICFAAAGVIGGAVSLARDTNLIRPAVESLTTSKELQKSIQDNIDTYALYLQMGLGIAGGFAAWRAGAFAAMQAPPVQEFVKRAAAAVGTASSVMGAGAQVGRAFANKRQQDMSALQRELDFQRTDEGFELSSSTKEAQKTLEEETEEVKSLHKMIKKLDIHVGG